MSCDVMLPWLWFNIFEKKCQEQQRSGNILWLIIWGFLSRIHFLHPKLDLGFHFSEM